MGFEDVENSGVTERIGNVVLDLTYYPGEDYYCDGAVEDELLDIVMNHSGEEYASIIEEKCSWPILYHLSPLRGNIVEWLPITKGAKALEIGAGCGAITGTLADKCARLDSVDLSKKRCMINAYRNKDRENLTLKVGNFKDIEPSLDADYDYIFLIGVFEYAQAYIGGDHPFTEFLSIIKKHLAANGKIVIAIENKLGLKYFAGCREDHLGDYFSGIEDYPEGGVVRTFTRNGLERICRDCGITEYSFYYPYPDYKFMTTLYSDRRLPEPGELTTNLRNLDRSRLLLFDEKNAFDGIIRDGEFPLFSNSYLLLIGKEESLVYTKYSNDRAPEYSIRTDIMEKNGERYVEKHALTMEAEEHLSGIQYARKRLSQRYQGSGMDICHCAMFTDEAGKKYLKFPYLKGETLEMRLDRCLEQQNMEQFYELLSTYTGLVRYQAEAQVTDYDFIFSNLLLDGERWQLIDYEWTYDRFVPPDKVAYRALLCYALGSSRRKNLNPEAIANRLGWEGIHVEESEEDELEFQMSVTGNHLSLSQMRDAIHQEVLPLRDAVEIYQQQKAAEMVQIYWNQGKGFSEAESVFVEPEREENDIYLSLEVPGEMKQVRIDPTRYACMITVHRILCYEGDDITAFMDGAKAVSPGRTGHVADGSMTEYPWKRVEHNGIEIAPQVCLFKDEDPNIILDRKYLGNASWIDMEYSVTPLDPVTVSRFAGKWKWRE